MDISFRLCEYQRGGNLTLSCHRILKVKTINYHEHNENMRGLSIFC